MKYEKFSTKFKVTNVSEVLFNAMQFTKRRMLEHYKNKNALAIRNEYCNFRIFTRFLFIRGDYGRGRQLRDYANNEMGNFMDMLLENERWS